MKLFARLMLVLFAVVTITGHGAAQPVGYHAHEHHQTDGHLMHTHDHADGAMVSIATTSSSDASSVEFCAQECEAPESEQSGAHFHSSCCVAFIALLHTENGVKTFALLPIDQPNGRSSLALGELHYPLLRPPRQVV